MYRQGKLDDAIAASEQALRTRPDEPEGMHLAATLYASAGRLQLALPLAQRACRAQPANTRYLVTLGKLFNAVGQAADAEPLFRKVLDLDPDVIPAWLGLAAAQQFLAQNEEALETLRQAVDRLGKPELIRAYASALVSGGQMEEAGAQFEKTLAVDETDALALNNLGLVRLWQGRPLDAVACFRTVLEQSPGDEEVLRNLAHALQAAGQPRAALACFDEIAAKRRLEAGELATRGSLLLSLGDRPAALLAFDDALSSEPGNAAALAGKAELLEWEGQYEAGLALLERDHGIRGQHPVTALVRARLLRRLGRAQDAIELLETHFEQQSLEASLRRRAHFTLGALYDETGDYARAFSQFEAAHALDQKKFDMDGHRRWVGTLTKTFTRASLSRLSPAAAGPVEVVFVLGMPRSGTSLVEQILARHPQVQACGERPEIGVLAQRLLPSLTQDGLHSLKPELLAQLAREYRAGAGRVDESVRYVTDKMPLNFFHLGLIQMLFPHARIVHCRRNPSDIALSCYFTDFIDPALAFAEDLAGLAEYYRVYARLMAHWQTALDLKRHEVVYEQLVQDQEKTTRALLEHLGLPWDARCLNFQEAARSVDTASHAQVRRPLYATSVGRSAHYARQLAAFTNALSED